MKKELLKASIQASLETMFPGCDYTFNVNDDGSITIVVAPGKG